MPLFRCRIILSTKISRNVCMILIRRQNARNRKEIEWTQALKRHLLDPIDILFYGIPAIITVKNSGKHQRLGDMWAKTIVVDIKDPEQYFTNKAIKPTSKYK